MPRVTQDGDVEFRLTVRKAARGPHWLAVVWFNGNVLWYRWYRSWDSAMKHGLSELKWWTTGATVSREIRDSWRK